jgi:hypothetical protein
MLPIPSWKPATRRSQTGPMGWDFWEATEVPLEELRESYGVRPVDADLLA